MGLKAVRRTLEKDLGLTEKALDPQKDLVASLVDKVQLPSQQVPCRDG